MKEKEERIFIRKGTARELCKFIYRDGCAGEMHCCSCAISIPRSEVIERMAKGLFKVDNLLALDIKWSQLKKSKQLTYKVFAEAALNALLEGHDDKR